jgi:hypothetical protein
MDTPSYSGSREPYDAADPKQIEASEKAVQARLEERRQFVMHAMMTPGGRAWFGQFLRDCHTMEKRFSMTGSTLETEYFNGQQSIGQGVLIELVKHSPEGVRIMLLEQDGVL